MVGPRPTLMNWSILTSGTPSWDARKTRDCCAGSDLPEYEVEFIGQRSDGRNTGFLSVPEWNVTAIPLPFINILMDFSDVAEVDGFTIRFPIPEAYFLHKLIIARKRSSGAKRGKDLEQ